MYRYILFDFDGTVFDTLEGYYEISPLCDK